MPQNITDVSTFTDPVVAPTDGDVLNAASVTAAGVGFQALANRTRQLLDLVDPEFVYLTPTTRKRTIEATDAHASASGAGVLDWFLSLSAGVPYLVPRLDAVFAVFPIDVPSGCTIAGVEVLVRSSGARVTPNGWFVRVYEQSEPWAAPAAPTATQQGSTTEGGLAAGYSVITVGSLTPFLRLAEYTAHVVVTGPIGALGANDQLLAVRVSFDDGGPRNA